VEKRRALEHLEHHRTPAGDTLFLQKDMCTSPRETSFSNSPDCSEGREIGKKRPHGLLQKAAKYCA
jgi:hypothetical protein